MTMKRIVGGGTALVLLSLLIAWFAGAFAAEDKLVTELKTLAAEPPSPEKRDSMRQLLEARMEGASAEQRQKMFEQLAPIFIPIAMKRFETEYDRFMAMSPDERQRELDRRIDAIETRRRNGQGPGDARPGGQRSPEEVDAFRKRMLDMTTPEQRAKFENGMRMFNDRRAERGLEPIPFM